MEIRRWQCGNLKRDHGVVPISCTGTIAPMQRDVVHAAYLFDNRIKHLLSQKVAWDG